MLKSLDIITLKTLVLNEIAKCEESENECPLEYIETLQNINNKLSEML